MLRGLIIFGASALASGALVTYLASRSRDRIMAQAAATQVALQRQLTGQGATAAAYLQSQGTRAERELRAMAERVGADAAQRQATATLAAYGITPSVLADVQRAVVALRG